MSVLSTHSLSVAYLKFFTLSYLRHISRVMVVCDVFKFNFIILLNLSVPFELHLSTQRTAATILVQWQFICLKKLETRKRNKKVWCVCI